MDCSHEGLTELRAAAPLPITGLAQDYRAGQRIKSHVHDCGQLLYAVQGVLEVLAEGGRWLVPPTRAVWLRAGVAHGLRMRGQVKVRSLFVSAEAAQSLPDEDCVIEISPLLRELISEVARWPEQDPAPADAMRRRHLVVELLLQELSRPPALSFHLPWPQDERMAGVCEALSGEGASGQFLPATATQWAQRLAMGEKSFHRHFQRATGLSFGRWRQRARLLASMQGLLTGRPILQVALDAGYESHSAYALAFKRHFGISPSEFGATAKPM
ncbi:AraC family transcriptional regulator [Comamonas composti]|uniref:AraC family transcriptional regulator n=1 Tax=Comamonas composti TaxID=408558 RepID=UPI000686814C|nr:helix-turn-helix transcriptional regulator [Comamonas composti]